MGVPVTEYQTVPLSEVEDGVDVWEVVVRAGGRRRAVDVSDVVAGVVDGDGCGDDFEVRVGDGDVNWIEGDGVMDDESDSTSSSSTRTIFSKNVIVWNVWRFVSRLELSFLYSSNFDVVMMEEMAEPLSRTRKAIAIPL